MPVTHTQQILTVTLQGCPPGNSDGMNEKKSKEEGAMSGFEYLKWVTVNNYA